MSFSTTKSYDDLGNQYIEQSQQENLAKNAVKEPRRTRPQNDQLENKLSSKYVKQAQLVLDIQWLLVEELLKLQKGQQDLISSLLSTLHYNELALTSSSRQSLRSALLKVSLYIISIAAKSEHQRHENNLFENSGFLLSSGNQRCEEYEDPTNVSFNFSDRSTNIRDINDDLTFGSSSKLQEFDTQSQRVLQSWLELLTRKN